MIHAEGDSSIAAHGTHGLYLESASANASTLITVDCASASTLHGQQRAHASTNRGERRHTSLKQAVQNCSAFASLVARPTSELRIGVVPGVSASTKGKRSPRERTRAGLWACDPKSPSAASRRSCGLRTTTCESIPIRAHRATRASRTRTASYKCSPARHTRAGDNGDAETRKNAFLGAFPPSMHHIFKDTSQLPTFRASGLVSSAGEGPSDASSENDWAIQNA